MKLKLTWLLTLFMAFVMQFSFAQEKTVTGTVTTADDGLPLPGASVIVKGTSRGAQTDFDGIYTINANVGDVLVVSYVGMKTTEITIGAGNTYDVVLQLDGALDEVVITGQGIKRSEKSLGYAVTTIKAEQIESRPQADIAQILTGQIAGVEVNTGGGFLGTQSSVIIRSKNSISGNNQPLYIVDGAPISGDRSFDIDPNNIASTTVLKGLAASTLYGQDGRNGVIIITTKTGAGGTVNKGFEVTVNATTALLEVSNLPEFQNTYGQGSDNNINTTFFGTWGAAFDGQIVPHPLSIAEYAGSFPEFQGATVEYKAEEDNVNDFFNTGQGQILSVIMSNSFDENSSISASFGRTDQSGYISENGIKRYNFGFGGRTKLANKLSFNTSVTYNNTFTKRPTRNFFTLLTWIPRNLDIQNLPFEDPNDGSSVYYRTTITNPRWQQKYTAFNETTNRTFIKAGLDYELGSKIRASYIYSLDNVSARNEDYQSKGGADNILGFLQTFERQDRVTNHRFVLSGSNYNLGENVSMNVVLGGEAKSVEVGTMGIFSEDQIVFNFNRHNNFREQTAIEFDSKVNTVGVYGQLETAYKNYAYLTLSARNDWASTVEDDNKSLFYPSVSLSLIPTSMFEGLKGAGNNYIKVRGSYGTSANFPNPYLTRENLNATANAYINPFTGGIVSTNSLSSFLPNADLRPELLKEFEVGIETVLFNRFIDLDLSVYKRIVEDQILNSALAPSTGFNSTVINAGRIDTDGLEASLTFNFIQPKEQGGFAFSNTNIFTAYETTVIELPVDRVNISSGVNFAIEGEAYGVFRGTFAVKDDQGNLLINPETGKIIFSDDVGLEDEIIGDPNEDFRYSNITNLSYKGFTFNMQWEYVSGGDIYSQTASNLLRRGVTTDTDNREGSYIIPGVLGDPNTGVAIVDGNGDQIQNNIQIGANDLYFINLQDVDENLVYDASTVRLRNVSLSYAMSPSTLERTPFGSVVFTISGNNLWYETPNIPKGLNLDPEVLSSGAGNGKGLDFQNDPSYRQYSFGVKLTF